jgi:VWFA-related protein
MCRAVRLAVVAVLLAATGQVGSATPQQDPSSPAARSLTSDATAVLVDVVVRDRKGRLVSDLSPADFAIAEDGVEQQIDAFTRVSRGGGIGLDLAWRSPTPTTTIETRREDVSAPDAPSAEPGTTALVFDHLSAESLRLAQRATLDYVPMNGDSTDRVAVFATDPGVRVVQGYTTDRALVRRGVAKVLPAGTAAADEKRERADDLVERRQDLREQGAAATASGAAGGVALARNAAEMGAREAELRMVETELNMIRSFDNLDRNYRGYDTALALLSVVQSLAQFPGRKTIVFFSEGLPVSPALAARLDHVIDAANRANVTAYAVDANGLRARSTANAMTREMQSFVDERLNQLATGNERTSQPLTMAFERVEDTLRLDSRTGLARLALDTGGFLVEGSNDLSSAFRRIDEDNRFHYLLSYSPKNSDLDGSFRTIQVKVRRPGTQVFARKGYRALRSTARDAGSAEAAALALLDRSRLPNAFPVHAAAFSFPDPSRPGLTPVLVRVGTGALRFTVDQKRGTYAAHATVVVRIRDAAGRDAHRVSQQYLLTGEAKDLEAAKQGEILFYREVDLPAGLYGLEAIVFDATTGDGSARAATLTVSPPASGVGMSSLVLVNRVEEVADPPATRDGSPPLYVGNRLLYPNLGEPIRRDAAGELPFYFALYGNAQGAGVSAQLYRAGQLLADAPVQLPSAQGPRVQHVGRLPVGALPAGTYELRISVRAAGRDLSQAAFFTLRD